MPIFTTAPRGKGWRSSAPWVSILPPSAPFAHRSRDKSAEPRDPSAWPHLSIKKNVAAYTLVDAAGAIFLVASSDVGKAACNQLPQGECDVPKVTMTSSATAAFSYSDVFSVENPIAGDDFNVVIDRRSFPGAVTDTTSGAIFSRFG